MQIQKSKKVKLHVEREVYIYIDKFKQAGSTMYWVYTLGGVSRGGQTCWGSSEALCLATPWRVSWLSNEFRFLNTDRGIRGGEGAAFWGGGVNADLKRPQRPLVRS